LFDIFQDFLKTPESLDSDCRSLLSTFERLRTKPELPSSSIELIWSEIGSGDTSTVTLSPDSNGRLSAVKTLLSLDQTDLIRREAAILKELKHPLILNIREHLSDNSAIVTEFAGNGSLANYFPPSQSRLKGANRIAKVIIGIALAMRFVHSRGFFHRDLKPANILLDWDWNVRIADYGQSKAPDNSDIPSLVHFKPDQIWPSVDFRYHAPECYENGFLQASDVFFFVWTELLGGQSAFPEDLEQHGIANLVVNEEPPI
jgi:serine/threonine protein kinase